MCLTGLVQNCQKFSKNSLKGHDVRRYGNAHPKKGESNYRGGHVIHGADFGGWSVPSLLAASIPAVLEAPHPSVRRGGGHQGAVREGVCQAKNGLPYDPIP